MEDGGILESLQGNEVRQVLCIVSRKTSLGRLQQAFDNSGLKHLTYQTRPRCTDTLAVPTRLQADDEGHDVATEWLADHDSEARVECVESAFFTSKPKKTQASSGAQLRSFLDSTCSLLADHVSSSDLVSLRSRLPTSFAIYGSLLLFPPGSCTTPEWQDPRLEIFWEHVCRSTGTTHIAANAPIARYKFDDARSISGMVVAVTGRGEFTNVIRSPTSLLPLYGDFGPAARTDSSPTGIDFRAAYWTETKQNGIVQVWAPLHTMFSAGNHKEKARILHLPSVLSAVAQGREDGRGCAAVDLFVGIGYFAFSYLKAGVGLVIGWDLNPWSIEGLRRGAAKNKWVMCVEPEHEYEVLDANARLLAFIGDNATASTWIQDRRCHLPPIRHVNLGLLPTSRGSWSVALDVLDKTSGGWLHIHENFGAAELDARGQDVKAVLESLVAADRRWPDRTSVVLEKIFKVKSFAPGVYHCVLDFCIDVSSVIIDLRT